MSTIETDAERAERYWRDLLGMHFVLGVLHGTNARPLNEVILTLSA